MKTAESLTCCVLFSQPAQSRVHPSLSAALECRPLDRPAPAGLASQRPERTGPPPFCCGIPPKPGSKTPGAQLQPLPAHGYSESSAVEPLHCWPAERERMQKQLERMKIGDTVAIQGKNHDAFRMAFTHCVAIVVKRKWSVKLKSIHTLLKHHSSSKFGEIITFFCWETQEKAAGKI